MLRETLQSTIEAAVAALVREGRLPATVADVPVEISDTKSPDHGDYACNLALTASKKAGMNPRALAETLKEAIQKAPLSSPRAPTSNDGNAVTGDERGVGGRESKTLIAAVEVAGPGFLNLRLHPEAVAFYVEDILATENLAHVKNPNPQRINVEFVSVNPNGPITIGSGRGAAFGSALCNVLEAAGNVVHREYYINDGVNSEQMRQFAESVKALAGGQPVPEKGYKGEYVQDVADQVTARFTISDIEFYYEFWQSKSKQQESQLNKMQSDSAQNIQNAEILLPDLKHLEQLIAFSNKQCQLFADILNALAVNQEVSEELRSRYGEEVKQYDTAWYQQVSQKLMVDRQRGDLEAFGVEFDTWFSEQSLHDGGIVASRIQHLEDTKVADEEPYRTKLKLGKGGVVEETIREEQVVDEDDVAGEGTTLWLRSTKFGDDMDRVLRRRDGRLTYIASDVSYHENKLTRPENATKMITILGPDHHGYIGRLTAVVAALLRGPEDTPEANAAALAMAKEKLEVVIYQLVRFLKDGKPAPMRKRDGNIYELRDLLDELGKNLVPDGTKDEQRTTGRDVARFFYLMRSHDTTMDFDIDLATQQSDENPVFYAQYAHARICSVLSKATSLSQPGTAKEWAMGEGQMDISLLVHTRETALIKKILDLPWEAERIAKDYGVHRLTTYAVELARTYHHFYDACRVIQPDHLELSWARLALCQATKKALKAAFDLLGVSAPERLDRRAVPEGT